LKEENFVSFLNFSVSLSLRLHISLLFTGSPLSSLLC